MKFVASLLASAIVLVSATSFAASSASKDVEIPVVTKNVRVGEAVDGADVTFMKIRESRTRGVILDSDELVGKTARRNIAPNRPIRVSDVGEELLVTRNASVSMEYRKDGMTLSTTGRSLDNGSRGDSIRVVNLGSRKTVKGVVIGPNVVEVEMK